MPAHGVLRLAGDALGVGATFTQADIDAGRLTYQFDQGSATADAFTFTVRDGGNHALYNRAGGIYAGDNVTLAVQTFTITIGTGLTGGYTPPSTLVTDPGPTIAINLPLQSAEGAVGVIDSTLLSITDADNDPATPATPPAAITITLNSLPTGAAG